jgi:hypothetical protein
MSFDGGLCVGLRESNPHLFACSNSDAMKAVGLAEKQSKVDSNS